MNSAVRSPAIEPGDEVVQMRRSLSDEAVGDMIRLYRDWRIDLEAKGSSLVFMIGGKHKYKRLAPVPRESMHGRELVPAFDALERAIVTGRAAAGRPRSSSVLAKFAPVDSISTIDTPRSFAVTCCGVRCRVQQITETKFHVRITSELLELDQLGMPESIKSKLLSHELNEGGLVIVCGGYGSGKTSTVNAVIRERVARRGGYALVMGNPIEYLYAGYYGDIGQPGFIEQIDLVGRNLLAEAKASMRNFPAGEVSILGWPELIECDGVGEMLRAANRGSLVFCDMHALNVEAAVLNLVAMGEQDGEKFARDLLGNAIRMIVHLRMTPAPNTARGLSIGYTCTQINRSMRAAILDPSMPLVRAITGVVTEPNSPSRAHDNKGNTPT